MWELPYFNSRRRSAEGYREGEPTAYPGGAARGGSQRRGRAAPHDRNEVALKALPARPRGAGARATVPANVAEC